MNDCLLMMPGRMTNSIVEFAALVYSAGEEFAHGEADAIANVI